jgi:hypothetical protein
MLTAIERVNSRGRWLYRCQCGTVKSIDSNHVRSGHTRSCGCLAQTRKPKADRKSGPKRPRPKKNKRPGARDDLHLYTVSGIRLKFSGCPTGVSLRVVRRAVDDSDVQLTKSLKMPRREVDVIMRALKIFDPDATARMFKRHPMVIRRIIKVMKEKRGAAKAPAAKPVQV